MAKFTDAEKQRWRTMQQSKHWRHQLACPAPRAYLLPKKEPSQRDIHRAEVEERRKAGLL